jgi:hypothetical protein
MKFPKEYWLTFALFLALVLSFLFYSHSIITRELSVALSKKADKGYVDKRDSLYLKEIRSQGTNLDSILLHQRETNYLLKHLSK